MQKPKIDKIIVTGQILRNNIYPIKWIYELFAYYLNEVTNLPVYYTTTKGIANMQSPHGIDFDISKFYNCYSLSYEFGNFDSEHNKYSWIKVFNNKDFNKDAYEYTYSVFNNALVICFETEACIVNILNHYNIPNIELNLDPIRFLDDVMLCFKSSDKEIYNKILKYRVDEEFLYMNAAYIKSVYMYRNFYHNYSENNCLFLGQTTCDKTLIDEKNNEIYTIINHEKEFLDAISSYDNVFYKRHPYVQNDEDIMQFIKSFDNISVIDGNFYELISRPDIRKVISISSGSCSEAKYFKKETQTLLKEGVIRQTENKFDKNKYISVYKDVFSLNFWSDILSPVIKTKKYSKKLMISRENLLRNSKDSLYYSYEDFDKTDIYNRLGQVDNNITNFDEKFKSFDSKIKKTALALEIMDNI